MAVLDAYSPCPCGSGQKFKWCCQKVEAFAERSQRLYDNGQLEGALGALDEGLRKVPDNPWLLVRKAVILAAEGRSAEARPLLQRVLDRQPGHAGAQSLMIRVLLETEGVEAGIAQLQRSLAAADAERRTKLAPMVQLVGLLLNDAGYVPAALKHLELARSLAPLGEEAEALGDSSRRTVESNPAVPPWLKVEYDLVPPPAGLGGPDLDRFKEAVRQADSGLWAAAASEFEALASGEAGPAAARNLGVCRLWLADFGGAASAIRRSIADAGETVEAVDLEALAQLLEPPGKDDLVERVQLIWPLRDREALLKTLRGAPEVEEAGVGPIDPTDEDSPQVDHFNLLDRPALSRTAGLGLEEIPRVVARILVGQEIAALEAHDDDRLGGLGDRFTALAGPAIAPAHPRTKVVGEDQRSSIAFRMELALPAGLDPAEITRLQIAQQDEVIREGWANTPLPYLGGRSPRQAAQTGDAHRALRAAVFRMEVLGALSTGDATFAKLRQDLGLDPEPEVDPEGLDPERLHPARLHLVPADRLDDDRLTALYARARRLRLNLAVERAARALVDRTSAVGTKIAPFSLYSELASLAAARGRRDEAFDWIQRGRQAEPPAQRTRNAAAWDMLEIQIRTRLEPPETWVPELAVVMDRHGDNKEANQSLLMSLVAMGLIAPVSHPDRPEEVMLDPRPLQALMAMYGPKVTTASGRLGVSATKGEIWTPGASTSGASGGIWTPGTGTPGPSGGGDKPKLIIPGR